jgi:hypothetical protein
MQENTGAPASQQLMSGSMILNVSRLVHYRTTLVISLALFVNICLIIFPHHSTE